MLNLEQNKLSKRDNNMFLEEEKIYLRDDLYGDLILLVMMVKTCHLSLIERGQVNCISNNLYCLYDPMMMIEYIEHRFYYPSVINTNPLFELQSFSIFSAITKIYHSYDKATLQFEHLMLYLEQNLGLNSYFFSNEMSYIDLLCVVFLLRLIVVNSSLAINHCRVEQYVRLIFQNPEVRKFNATKLSLFNK